MLLKDHANIGIELLHRMKRIRGVEEMIAARYPEEKMRCPIHLSIGQEAVAAAAGMALRQDDPVVSTHRCHAHYIGKNGNMKAMIAELYGKMTGCCGGRGGSMHLCDVAVGFMGSSAIVGNSIPMGVGLALSHKLLGNGRISGVFMGDAAVEEGVFHESINFAVLKKLPVLFICENNFYSVYTHLRDRQPEGRQIWKWVASYGLRTEAGDGNDAWTAYQKILTALEYIRAGGGPVFLEFYTYRWREHCGPAYDNDLGYRSVGEFNEWKQCDPLPRLEQPLVDTGILNQDMIAQMDEAVEKAIAEAFRFAEVSPFPPSAEAFTGLFAN